MLTCLHTRNAAWARTRRDNPFVLDRDRGLTYRACSFSCCSHTRRVARRAALASLRLRSLALARAWLAETADRASCCRAARQINNRLLAAILARARFNEQPRGGCLHSSTSSHPESSSYLDSTSHRADRISLSPPAHRAAGRTGTSMLERRSSE